MMGDENSGMIWELYGLKQNPFTTAPILLEGGVLPPETFVGRNEELRTLFQLFKSEDSSRTIVTGQQGVGKTTFVNCARKRALDGMNAFTPIKEIAIQRGWGVDDFIINTLASIFTTIKRKDIKMDASVMRRMHALLEVIEMKNMSGSFSVFGLGVGVGGGGSVNLPPINTTALLNLFEDVIDAIIKGGKSMVVLHYNNLELFEPEEITRIFNAIRDMLQTSKVHFVFVGNLTVPPVIESIERVRSIFSETIILDTFDLAEIREILDRRIKCFKIESSTLQVPYEEGVIKSLHKLYGGNVRPILNSLSKALREIVSEKPIVLNQHILQRTLKNIVEKKWLEKMTENEKLVLFKILEDGESTNKKLAGSLKKHPQNISKITNDLKDQRAIYIKHASKREKYFAVCNEIKWLNLEEGGKDSTASRRADSLRNIDTLMRWIEKG